MKADIYLRLLQDVLSLVPVSVLTFLYRLQDITGYIHTIQFKSLLYRHIEFQGISGFHLTVSAHGSPLLRVHQISHGKGFLFILRNVRFRRAFSRLFSLTPGGSIFLDRSVSIPESIQSVRQHAKRLTGHNHSHGHSRSDFTSHSHSSSPFSRLLYPGMPQVQMKWTYSLFHTGCFIDHCG